MRTRWTTILSVLMLLGLAWTLMAIPVAAQDLRFRLDQEICRVYINDDGSIWIDYQFTFTADRGSHAIDIVDVGMPNNSYKLSEVQADVDGVQISDIRYSTLVKPGVEIHMGKFTIQPGQTGSLHVLARAQQMVFQDTSDPEYAGMEFSPNYYSAPSAHGTTRLEVIIVFPKGVTSEETRYHAIKPSDMGEVDGNKAYVWKNDQAQPGPLPLYGVSFPKTYLKSGLELKVTPVPAGGTTSGGASPFSGICSGPVCIIAFGIAFLIIVGVISNASKRRKMQYLPPTVSVEGAGIKRGLTAVEAAILLDAPMNKVLTMILFALLKKGAVIVKSQDPLSLQVTETDAELHEYEKGFLASIGNERILENKLRPVIIDLIKGVNEKIKGFSRKETVTYYKDLVSRAWQQVEQADTPEVKSAAFDEQLEWTMLDDEWQKRVGRTFQDQPVFLPIWWGRYRPWATATGSPASSAPQPAKTITAAPGPEARMPTLPGAAFAGTIVGGFQGVANKVVSSIDRFTGSITAVTNPPPPPPPSTGRRGGWSGGGGHSCACACACASCACACAGGGR